MTEFVAVRMPQSGPNDATATLVEWNGRSGQPVHQGEIIATAETTKSVFEIEAPAAGYLTVLAAWATRWRLAPSIGVLSSVPAAVEAVRAWVAALDKPVVPAAPAGAKGWTVKAELLAQRHGLDVADVPGAGERVTEADVQAYLAIRRGSRLRLRRWRWPISSTIAIRRAGSSACSSWAGATAPRRSSTCWRRRRTSGPWRSWTTTPASTASASPACPSSARSTPGEPQNCWPPARSTPP